MPRTRKPARLYLRPDTGEWVIRDGTRTLRTGARGDGGRDAAEAALRRYLADRAPERIGPARADEITCGEVLALYAKERGGDVAAPATLAFAIKALAPFWGGQTVEAVKGATCRAYVRERAKPPKDARGRVRSASAATARRELGVLQAALNYAHGEGRLIHPVKVTLPASAPPKDRWLTRSEVAKLLRAATPALRRFILVSVYTGTRSSAVLKLRWGPSLDSGWIDLERGVLHRRGERERETAKRRGSVRMPRQLRAHMRRWQRGPLVVGYASHRSMHKAWRAACAAAGIEGATPHTLKHTAVTWAFQKGMSREDATDFFDTTAQTLERVYRQHSPDHQSRAVEIMERRR